MKLRIIVVCLLAVFSGSCIAKQAKVTSKGILAGQQFHKEQDQKVYQKLLYFVEHNLEKMLETKRRELDLLEQRFQGRIYKEINQAYFDGLAQGFSRIDETTEKALEDVTDKVKRRELIGVGAVQKVRLVEDGKKLRQGLLDRLLKQLESEVSSAKQELEKVRIDSQALAAQIREPLTIIQQHHDQLIASQEQLDAYLHKKSEITLIASGFLQGLGIPVDDGRIEERVNNISDTLEAKANEIINRVNNRFTAVLGQATAPVQ
jgi:hypothetical protein